VVDIKTGRAYYFNRMDKKVQWERPKVFLDQIQEFPFGWECMLDHNSGKVYHRSLTSGARKWEWPCGDDFAQSSGWQAVVDVASTKVYYRNAQLSRTQWERPSPQQELPPGWETSKDPSSGRAYYVNRALGLTQWERPGASQPLGASQPPQPPSREAMDRRPPQASSQPPLGWKAFDDPGSGKVIYQNETTGETRWDLPPDEEEPSILASSKPPALANAPQAQAQAAQRGPTSDWKKFSDTKSGKVYYHNEVTDETRWDLPPGVHLDDEEREVQKDEEKLPSGWKSMVDPESGRTIYMNPAAGKVTFEHPSKHQALDIELPEGWSSMVEPTTGRSVFVNLASGKLAKDAGELSVRVVEEAEARKEAEAQERRRLQEQELKAAEEAERKRLEQEAADAANQNKLAEELPTKVEEALAAVPLTIYFSGSYLEGKAFLGESYTRSVHDDLRISVLEHAATGTKVWAEALDLRSAAPNEPFLVFYHYTGRVPLACISRRTILDDQLLTCLFDEFDDFGKGIYASRKDPGTFGIASALLMSKYWPQTRSDQQEQGPSEDAARRTTLAEFCVPILVPAKFAHRLSKIEPSEAERPSGALDAWILQLPSDICSLVGQTGLVAKIDRCQKRAKHLEETDGSGHADTLMACYDLASSHFEHGSRDAAEQLLRRVVEGDSEVLQAIPEGFRLNIAELLMNMGMYSEAEPLFRKALASSVETLGQTHQVTLRTGLSLGLVLKQLGKLEESETLHRMALKDQEETLGSTHPDTLVSVNNLSEVLKDMGNYEEAEKLCRRGLEGSREALGPRHTDTLIAMNNLATVLKILGKQDEAEEHCRLSFEGAEATLGPVHPFTLMAMDNLAKVLEDSGQLEAAEPLLRRQLQGLEEAMGSKHPNTLVAVASLAALLWAAGQKHEAEQLYRRACTDCQEVLGSQHMDTMIATINLAEVLRSRGKLADAEPLCRAAVQGLLAMVGPEHPETYAAARALAALLQEMGREDEASQVLSGLSLGSPSGEGPAATALAELQAVCAA